MPGSSRVLWTNVAAYAYMYDDDEAITKGP